MSKREMLYGTHLTDDRRRNIANFFGRLFNSKGFRRGLWIFAGVFVVYYLYNVIIFLSVVMDTGVSLGEALRFYFELLFFDSGFVPPSAGIALGLAIGLVWYFHMKKKKQENAGPDPTEKSSDPAQEEEINETTHYRYQ